MKYSRVIKVEAPKKSMMELADCNSKDRGEFTRVKDMGFFAVFRMTEWLHKNFIILFLLLFLSVSHLLSQGVSLDNTGGRINNIGTLRIKSGQVKNLNDTIDGRVEFTSIVPAFTQEVPNIVYNQLLLSGLGLKIIDTVRKVSNLAVPLVTRDSLLLMDSTRINLFRGDVWARGSVANSSSIVGNKEIRLIGDEPQDIWGWGNFPVLNIDNPFGVTVIRGGGFHIDQRLVLSRGEFRNSISSNFSVGDSVTIVRYVGASLSEKPMFGRSVNVQYRGSGRITSGPELPDDASTLRNMEVHTTNGLVLTKDVTVNDTLLLSSTVYTEPSDTERYVLTHTSPNDPIYVNSNAEIDGSYRKTNLRTDSTKILFNNAYTYFVFPNPNSTNGASELTLRVKPHKFPSLPGGDQKVRRSISLTARDISGNAVSSIYPIFGYGWRHSPDTSIDETNGLDIYRLKLQWWDGNNWVDVGDEDVVQVDSINGWAYNVVKRSNGLNQGEFAIGSSWYVPIAFWGKAILEGAWRGGTMVNDLQKRNLLPSTPPDIFPYNRDPQRANISVTNFPDSVVDWIVVEFRRTYTDPNPIVYTCFLRTDGSIIGRNGEYPLSQKQIRFDSGKADYFVAILHRNHLAVITEEPVNLRDSIAAKLDFTRSELVMGREGSMKPLAKTTDDRIIFGLFAGDINADGVIDIFDQNDIWLKRDFEGYLVWDVSLSGIITTRDLNFAFNNRNRKSLVPK